MPTPFLLGLEVGIADTDAVETMSLVGRVGRPACTRVL